MGKKLETLGSVKRRFTSAKVAWHGNALIFITAYCLNIAAPHSHTEARSTSLDLILRAQCTTNKTIYRLI